MMKKKASVDSNIKTCSEDCPDRESNQAVGDILKLVSVPPASSRKMGDLVTGILAGFSEQGNPLVNFPGNPLREPVAALFTSAFFSAQIGDDVVLMFEDCDPLKPVILGFLRPKPANTIFDALSFEIDGRRIIFNAKTDFVIRCGEASVTLTPSGKIIISGEYIVSESKGLNHIKGGKIKLN
jgi:hypothetical protein